MHGPLTVTMLQMYNLLKYNMNNYNYPLKEIKEYLKHIQILQKCRNRKQLEIKALLHITLVATYIHFPTSTSWHSLQFFTQIQILCHLIHRNMQLNVVYFSLRKVAPLELTYLFSFLRCVLLCIPSLSSSVLAQKSINDHKDGRKSRWLE